MTFLIDLNILVRLPMKNFSDKPEKFSSEVVKKINTPGRIRTSDRRIRNPLLYPAELRALVGL